MGFDSENGPKKEKVAGGKQKSHPNQKLWMFLTHIKNEKDIGGKSRKGDRPVRESAQAVSGAVRGPWKKKSRQETGDTNDPEGWFHGKYCEKRVAEGDTERKGLNKKRRGMSKNLDEPPVQTCKIRESTERRNGGTHRGVGGKQCVRTGGKFRNYWEVRNPRVFISEKGFNEKEGEYRINIREGGWALTEGSYD